MTLRRVFKQFLKRDKLLVAPGCFDGLSARLVEEAGFEAAYFSGGAVARSMGLPDIGLVTMSEVIERAAQVVSAGENFRLPRPPNGEWESHQFLWHPAGKQGGGVPPPSISKQNN